jgi:hypothetical protein
MKDWGLTMAQVNKTYSLQLGEEERSELLHVLRHFLTETHTENRRTDNLEYRAELRHEESVLRSLLEKVRKLAD